MLSFRKFVALAVLGVMLPNVAEALTVTITSNYVGTCASDGPGGCSAFIGTTIPASQSISAIYGTSTSNTDINYSILGDQTILSHDFQHSRAGGAYHYAQTYANAIVFTVDIDTIYTLSGYYTVDDVSGAGTSYLNGYLYDQTSNSILLSSTQSSQNTADESFILGLTEGDASNNLEGSLTGDLLAGHSYVWRFNAYTQAYPDADGGASAVGNVTLKIGGSEAVPLPAAFPLLASGLGGLGLLGWRRKRKAVATTAA